MKQTVFIFAVLILVPASGARAQKTGDVADLSLQDLLNVEITSVSFKQQTVSRTAASVYVISAADIERSGATTLPDALRMVPGFTIAQVNATAWSVTSRGFGGLSANKVLLLVDGRSVYSEVSGAVNWGVQFPPLDLVKQIEVIRGPGGSIWGANATNGVVNIITKSAAQMEGGRVVVHASRYEPGTGDLMYGGTLGGSAHYIASARYFQRESPGTIDGLSHPDASEAFNARLRIDWSARQVHSFWVSAATGRSTQTQTRSGVTGVAPYKQVVRDRFMPTQGNLTFSWSWIPSSRVENTVLASYSHTDRPSPLLGDRQDALDVNAGQRRAIGLRHEIVTGVQFRGTSVDITSSPSMMLAPAHHHTRRVTAYLQDEIRISNTVRVTPGFRTENDGQALVEALPSLRTVWNPTRNQAVWAAVSRGLRTPSLIERSMHRTVAIVPTTGPAPVAVTIDGASDIDSEVLNAVEAGYRMQAGPFAFDIAAFEGHYHDLISAEPSAAVAGRELGVVVVRRPSYLINGYSAESDGGEAAVTWTPGRRTQFSTGYALVDVVFRPQAGTLSESANLPAQGSVPRHQWNTRALFDVAGGTSVSVLFFHASAMPTQHVDAYGRLDVRAARPVAGGVRVSVGAQNLFRPPGIEFVDSTGVLSAPVHPNAYLDVIWNF